MVDQGDEGGVHAAGVSAGEVGVGVVGVVFDLLVGHGDGGAGELLDAVAGGLGDGDAALGGEEGVVRVVGGVEEVLVVELAEDEHHEDVAGGDGALGIGLLDGFEAGEGAVVVEVVEVLVGLADLRGEIDGVGVGIADGLGEGRQRNTWQCEGDGEKDGGEDGDAAGLQNHSLSEVTGVRRLSS